MYCLISFHGSTITQKTLAHLMCKSLLLLHEHMCSDLNIQIMYCRLNSCFINLVKISLPIFYRWIIIFDHLPNFSFITHIYIAVYDRWSSFCFLSLLNPLFMQEFYFIWAWTLLFLFADSYEANIVVSEGESVYDYSWYPYMSASSTSSWHDFTIPIYIIILEGLITILVYLIC